MLVSLAKSKLIATTSSCASFLDVKVLNAAVVTVIITIPMSTGVTHCLLDSTSVHIFFILLVTFTGLKVSVGCSRLPLVRDCVVA